MSLALKFYEAYDLVEDFILCICSNIFIQIRAVFWNKSPGHLTSFGSCYSLKAHEPEDSLQEYLCCTPTCNGWTPVYWTRLRVFLP